ncbi:NMCC_0638 family (lipo)protein, partial [Neisseria sp. P0021.S005]
VNGADYYLSLTEDSCSVRTAKANDHLIFKQFLALAENPPQGLNAELRADNLSEAPLPMRQISYAWRASGSSKETLLTVKTTSSEHFPVQAVFYLTHHSYDNKAAVLP